MIRGRRGIAVAVYFFLAFFLVQPASAWEMNMTATVPVSPTWRTLIEQNSVTALDIHSHRNIANLSVEIRGIPGVTLPKQTVQALLFQNTTLIDDQIKTTDKKGNVDFTFVYKLEGNYRIMIIDTSDSLPFVIRTITF